ncbi:MAG: pseudouridine synthase [Planctomycetota bacterium]
MDALTVLHQDDECVAVDKPPGLLVHRTHQAPDRVVVLQMLRDQIGRHIYPVHRLDRPASGVLVFGLSPEGARRVQEQLAVANKEYLVFVRGETPVAFESDRPLKSERGVPQEAYSEFRRLAVVRGFSLLRVRIRTGRRHQIRRHLSHLGHQIVGDSQHGKGRINRWLRDDYGLPRMFLHARRLTLGELTLRARFPDDLRSFLRRFRA